MVYVTSSIPYAPIHAPALPQHTSAIVSNMISTFNLRQPEPPAPRPPDPPVVRRVEPNKGRQRPGARGEI